jgi:ferrous iron transport protein B
MLSIPCIATVAVMRQETRSWRWTLTGVGILLIVSYVAGVAVHQAARLLPKRAQVLLH